VDQVEVVVQGELNDPLSALGVVGARGNHTAMLLQVADEGRQLHAVS
jgi:hypothetical protein